MFKIDRQSFSTDFVASLVVFLVALPLCMGISIASGLPAEKGIITGIIGGLVVALIAGSPLQVSGPAAGLVVLVWEIHNKLGIEGLGIAVLLAGLVQIVAGLMGAGKIFRAVSPTVIYGMLSGIGVLIFSSQFHVMFDTVPNPSGLENILAIPGSISKAFDLSADPQHTIAAALGLLAIVTIVVWERFKPRALKMLPGALLGIGIASVAALVISAQVNYIEAPSSLLATFKPISFSALDTIFSISGMIMVLSLAIVASAETLLCASAVDKMHSGQRTNYDKELFAQGIGNTLCGFFGALPMTGVIVRSSANVDAGAKTRLSAFMHGAWLLAFVALVPAVLALIPTASLAALLVYIGYKLINFNQILEIKKRGWQELFIFMLTVSCIVGFDLLTGIAVGFVATLVQLIYRLTHLDLELLEVGDKGDEFVVDLAGAATFFSLPKLSDALESLPKGSIIHIQFHDLSYIDHACLELLNSWGDQHRATGGTFSIEWDELHSHTKPKVRSAAPEVSVNLLPKHSRVARAA